MKATILLLFLGACATAVTPSKFDIHMETVPPGAVVVHDGKPLGTTPCTITLPRIQRPVLTLRADGYRDQGIELGNVPAPAWAMLVDCILFPCLVVDALSNVDGALDTAPCTVHLTPIGSPPPVIWRRRDHDATAPRGTGPLAN